VQGVVSGAARRPARDLGVRLIVAYKAAKAIVEVAVGTALFLLAVSGEIATLQDATRQLETHVASRWSLLAARELSTVLTEHAVHLLAIGLLLDGVLSAVEGWSLWRGYRWGAWLVVLATATPLPLEVMEIARTHRASRVALALVNVAVVTYLARRIAKGRRR
jgi:uncharacterized membrane protein (DUF2068 family)